MKKKQIAGIVTAIAVATGAGVLATVLTGTGAATAETRPSAAPTATAAAPRTAADLTLAPGSIGPVKIGMTQAEADATSLFDTDVPAIVDGCASEPLVWKEPFEAALDVMTRPNGTIASLGVWQLGPTTAAGLGIGSSLDDVRAAYPDAKVVEAGYGQSGVLVHDANGWIGFLFSPTTADVSGTDQVTFIEITGTTKPYLMRDGC